MGPADDPVVERVAVVLEDGLSWASSRERIAKPVGFPAGARLILRSVNGHHEITGVELARPEMDLNVSAIRWRSAWFKKRESIERRLPAAWAKVNEAAGDDVRAVQRVIALEEEARAYNDLAQEMGLPRLRLQVPEGA